MHEERGGPLYTQLTPEAEIEYERLSAVNKGRGSHSGVMDAGAACAPDEEEASSCSDEPVTARRYTMQAPEQVKQPDNPYTTFADLGPALKQAQKEAAVMHFTVFIRTYITTGHVRR